MFRGSFVDYLDVMQCLHPELDQLERYALGCLNEKSDSQISRHLAECSECCDVIETLWSEIDALRESLHPMALG